MPKVIQSPFTFDRDQCFKKVKTQSYNSFWDRVTNLASDPFKSASETFQSVNKKCRPITFLATLALSTWFSSAIVRTGIGFLSSGTNPYLCSTWSRFLFDCQNVKTGSLFNWNWSVLSKASFLANGLAGLKILPLFLIFQTGMSYLSSLQKDENEGSAFKFPPENVSARKLGMNIGIGYNFMPTFFQKLFYTISWNTLLYSVLSIPSQIVFSNTEGEEPTTNKTAKIATIIPLIGTFYFGGAYSFIKGYFQ